MKSDNGFRRIQKLITPMLIYMVVTMLVEFVAMMGASLLVQRQYGSKILSDYEAYYTSVMGYIQNWLLYMTGAVAVLTAPILSYMYYRDSKRLDMEELNVSPFMYIVIALLGISLCFTLNAALSLTGLSALLEEGYQDTATAIYSQELWAQYLITAVLVPCMEELIFRGLIFRRMRTYAIFPLAALISAILFGLYHMNLLQFIYATCLGLVLALAYEKFRSIFAPIIIHGTANAFSVLLSTNESVQILLAGTEKRTIISTVITAVITVACLILLGSMNKKKGENAGEDSERSHTVL